MVDDLFDRIGGALPVSDTAAFNALIAASATVSTYFAYVGAVVDWAAGKGVPTADADRYLRSLFHGAATALGDDTRSLAQLKIAHETPGGINERVRTAWFDVAAPALGTTLDELNDATD